MGALQTRFMKHYIAPPNFEQSIVNARQDHLTTILEDFDEIANPFNKGERANFRRSD